MFACQQGVKCHKTLQNDRRTEHIHVFIKGALYGIYARVFDILNKLVRINTNQSTFHDEVSLSVIYIHTLRKLS